MAETGRWGPLLTCLPAVGEDLLSPLYLPQSKSESAFSCWPGTLLPPVGHSLVQASACNPPGRALWPEMPLWARKPGNSYKFNKICLINYSSSPRAWLAAPRSKNWAKLGSHSWTEVRVQGCGGGQWASAAASRMATWQSSWASGCTGNRSRGGGQVPRVAWCPHPLGSSVQTGHEQVQLPEGTAVAATQARLAPDEAADALELLIAEPALVQPAGRGAALTTPAAPRP